MQIVGWIECLPVGDLGSIFHFELGRAQTWTSGLPHARGVTKPKGYHSFDMGGLSISPVGVAPSVSFLFLSRIFILVKTAHKLEKNVLVATNRHFVMKDHLVLIYGKPISLIF